MGHYIANVRDLEFNLFEVLDIGAVLGTGRYSDLDVDTAKTILAEAARLAEGPVAETFAYADRNPPVFDPATHSISVAAGVGQDGGQRSKRPGGGGWAWPKRSVACPHRRRWHGESPK